MIFSRAIISKSDWKFYVVILIFVGTSLGLCQVSNLGLDVIIRLTGLGLFNWPGKVKCCMTCYSTRIQTVQPQDPSTDCHPQKTSGLRGDGDTLAQRCNWHNLMKWMCCLNDSTRLEAFITFY